MTFPNEFWVRRTSPDGFVIQFAIAFSLGPGSGVYPPDYPIAQDAAARILGEKVGRACACGVLKEKLMEQMKVPFPTSVTTEGEWVRWMIERLIADAQAENEGKE